MDKAKEAREVQHTKKLLWPVCMIQIFITRCVQTRTLGRISAQKDFWERWGTYQNQCVQWLPQAKDTISKTHSGRSKRTDCSNYHHSKQIMGKAKEAREVQHTKKLLWPVCMIQIFISRFVTTWLSILLGAQQQYSHFFFIDVKK